MVDKKLIIAIDGPSGAGKSTISRQVAHRLNYVHLDTGAMYRCVALAVTRKAIDLADTVALSSLCETLEIRFVPEGHGQRVICDSEDVSEAIRTPKNSLMTSRVAAISLVRDAMVELQRQMGAAGGVVLEGRDIGSVVFPEADAKFYLDASAKERGRRRYEELKGKGVDVDLEKTVSEIVERDLADSSREHSPLVKAEDAILVDSTNMSIEEVILFMLQKVGDKAGQ